MPKQGYWVIQINRYQFEPGGTWVESIGLKQRAATTRAMTEPDGLLAVHKAEKKGVLQLQHVL